MLISVRTDKNKNTCKLDRTWLNDERKDVFVGFEQFTNSLIVSNKLINRDLLKNYLKNFLNIKEPFTTYRKYIVNNWLNEIIIN